MFIVFCSRHRYDYGAVILMDDRFSLPGVCQHVSKVFFFVFFSTITILRNCFLGRLSRKIRYSWGVFYVCVLVCLLCVETVAATLGAAVTLLRICGFLAGGIFRPSATRPAAPRPVSRPRPCLHSLTARGSLCWRWCKHHSICSAAKAAHCFSGCSFSGCGCMSA